MKSLSILLRNLLRNSWLLVIVGMMSIISLGTFMYRNQNDYIAIFVISGAIASIFSRNMVVVLTMAMVCAWMVQWSRKLGGFREGMEDANDGADGGGDTILVSSNMTPDVDDTVVQTPTTTSNVVTTTTNANTNAVATMEPDRLEPDTPPTAVERKLDDLQIKLDTIQSEIFEIKNRN